MTIVDSGQQMSAVGQQALWSADHVIMSDKVKSETTAQLNNLKKGLHDDQIIHIFLV